MVVVDSLLSLHTTLPRPHTLMMVSHGRRPLCHHLRIGNVYVTGEVDSLPSPLLGPLLLTLTMASHGPPSLYQQHLESCTMCAMVVVDSWLLIIMVPSLSTLTMG